MTFAKNDIMKKKDTKHKLLFILIFMAFMSRPVLSQEGFIHEINTNGATTCSVNGVMTTISYTEGTAGSATNGNLDNFNVGTEDSPSANYTSIQFNRYLIDNNLNEIKNYIYASVSFSTPIEVGNSFNITDIDGSDTGNQHRDFALMLGVDENNNIVQPTYSFSSTCLTESTKSIVNIPTGLPATVGDMFSTIQAAGNCRDLNNDAANGTANVDFGTTKLKSVFFMFGIRDQLSGTNPGAQKIDIYQSEGLCDPFINPVKLTDFSVALIKNNVRLQWVTASEINNDYFEILHSNSGLPGTFTPIGKVIGENKSQGASYTFDQNNVTIGKHYYQLRQVDKDGTTTTFSKILQAEILKDMAFHIYPNPAQSYITIPMAYPVEIYNSQGVLLLSSAGQSSVDISSLPRGFYLVKITDPNGVTYTDKLIKN